MYILIMVVSIIAGPSAISTQQLSFSNEKRCLEAKAKFEEAYLGQYVKRHAMCLRQL